MQREDRLPLDPFGRSRLPAAFDRADRVRLLQEAANALTEGRQVSREAALFLGGAIGSWLVLGGSLERDYLRVRAPRGCHHTPQRLASMLSGESAEDAVSE